MTRARSIGRLAALCFVGLAGFVPVPPAFAAVELGPDVVVHPQEFVDPFFTARLAVLPTGGFLTGWEDGGVMRVKAVDPFDRPLWPSKALAPRSNSSTPPQPHLAAVGDRFIAVWTDAANLLRARFVDATGVPGTELTVAPLARGAAVASIPDGGFVIGWVDVVSPLAQPGHARAQRFDAQGLPQGPPIDLGKGKEISLAGQPGGAFAAAIYDDTAEPGYELNTLRIVDADGTFRGEPTVVREPDDSWYSPMLISADAAGRLVGAFARSPVHDDIGFGMAVMARRFSPNGEPVGDEVVVYAPDSIPYVFDVVDVAVRPDGAFLVAWWSGFLVSGGPSSLQASVFSDEDLGNGVLVRAFDGGGLPLGPAMELDDTSYTQTGEVDASPEGWVATWVRATLFLGEPEPDPGIHSRRILLPCSGDELCLGEERFRVQATWNTGGAAGEGRPLRLGGDSGAFWFFSPGNTELVVKVLDGRAINGQFWVFYGSLTDVEFDLTVTDTQTGATRTYHNPQGNMASVADVEALPGGDGSALPSAAKAAVLAGAAALAATSCSPDAACLRRSRYRATVDWRTATGQTGHGAAVPLTDETGSFWFFDSSNVELMVKVLDGRPLNGHHWVFYASLTDVEFDLTVVDTATGTQRVYHNPAGTLASRADTQAFPD